MRQDIDGKEAEELAADGAVPADKFIWHAVTRAVGNIKSQGMHIIQKIKLLLPPKRLIHMPLYFDPSTFNIFPFKP